MNKKVSNGSHGVVRNIVKVFSLSFKAAPVNLVLLILVSLIMGAWTILGAKAFSLFIDAIVGFIKSGSSNEVWYTLFLYIAIIITPNFLDIAHRFLDWKFYLRFQTYVELFILGKRANFDVAHYESSEFLDKLRHAFNQGTSPLKNISDRMIWVFRYGATAVVGSLAVLLIDWRVFCIIFILAIPQFIVELKANKTLWNISMSNSKEKRVYDHLNGFFFNRFSFIEAKLFGIHWNFIGRIKKLLTDFNEQQIPVEKKRALISIATEALSAVGIFAGMALIVQKALSGEVNVGSIVFVFSAASSAKDQMGNLFMQISRISSDSLYTEDIFKVIDAEPVVKESKTAKEISLDSAPIIEFRGVSFKYPGTEEFAVRDISFIMQPGDKIGLVGHNGSGKSTLVRLLLRFHDPTEGQILINGTDLREIKRDSWWEGLGVLLQDFSNFSFTVAETVAVSKIEKPVDREMVKQAVEMSALDGLVKSWPKGIDEQLGTEFGGRELSKGERQKAAVARVFYRNAPLTILDEPTAAVDSDSAMTIFGAVERMPADKSAVLISHNFATIRRATRVLVLEGGKLIESGTHDELMQKGGAYARSFRTQAEQFS